MVASPASFVVYWMVFTSRGSAVLSPRHDELVARTPELSPKLTSGLLAGTVMALAMFFLCWALLLSFLTILVICGVISSV